MPEFNERASCIPMRPNEGFYMCRSGLYGICLRDSALCAALRVLEVKTNTRIKALCDLLDIPDDLLPPEDMLWIDIRYQEFEDLTIHERGRTSFERALTDTPANAKHMTLQKLGFAKSRFVAYATSDEYAKSSLVKFTFTNRAFIVVMDAQGRYFDEQGQLCIAALDGFGEVRKQYLLLIDAVNAALDGIIGTPPPLPRWQPPQHDGGKQGGRVTQETTKSTDSLGMPPTNAVSIPSAQGGTPNAEDGTTFMHKDTITNKGVQEVSSDLAALRTAPPIPSTFLGLLSSVLAVPHRDRVSDAVWQRDWQGPIEAWLKRGDIMAWISMGHADWAWSNLEYVARYMATPGSPSWWQQKRTKPTPITLRHVVESYDAQGKDAAARNWIQPEATPYEGPPLALRHAEEPTTDTDLPSLHLVPKEPEPPPHLHGMDEQTAMRLIDRMAADEPELVLYLNQDPDGSFVTLFQVADDYCMPLRSPSQWTGPRTEKQQRIIEEAISFGRAWWDKERTKNNYDPYRFR